jgi:putative ABC transport system permease protein
MGANRAQIVRLLLWKFTQPVLLAALVACPIAALLLGRWLAHFAYRIDLTAWPFVASTVLTLIVALLTVATHCYSVASEKPVRALRCE